MHKKRHKLSQIAKEVLEKYGGQIGWRKIKKIYRLNEYEARTIDRFVKIFYSLFGKNPKNFIQSFPIHFNIPKKEVKEQNNCILFCLLSDWHIGETVNKEEVLVNEYDEEIAFARIDLLVEEVLKLINLHKPKKVVICLLGDMISGDIHGDIENIPLYYQISITIYLIGYFISQIQAIVNDIECLCVGGNHGRMNKTKKSKHNVNNYDLLVYDLLDVCFNNIPFTISKSPYLIKQIEEISVFLTHGKYLNLVMGLPFYSMYRKIAFNKKITYNLNQKEPTVTFIGHCHEPQNLSYISDRIFINGTLMGVNEYAFNKGLYSKPSQKIVIIYNENCIGNYDIVLDTTERKAFDKKIDSLKKALEFVKF